MTAISAPLTDWMPEGVDRMTSPAGTMRPSLDRHLARFVRPIEDALGPIVTLPVTPATPAYTATCEAVPEARACAHCGAIGDAPCVTCTGKACKRHAGRTA